MSLFQSLLQQAYWRGIPFHVDSQHVEKGRKVAIHDYPFRDGGWVEDLGRRQRVLRFTGHLIGDLAPVMQAALDAACEIPGPGLLVHPTLGAMQVALISASSAVHKEEMRVISVEFTFMEQGSSLFPSIVTDTINAVVNAVSGAATALGPAIAAGFVVLAAAAGAAAILEGVKVVSGFGTDCVAAASDPAAVLALATALPAPDADTSYGRYAAGSALTPLPAGSTVASLQALTTTQRVTAQIAAAATTTAANRFTATTAPALFAALSGVVEAVRAVMRDPADQIRTMTVLAGYSFTDSAGGSGLSGDVAIVRNAFAAACRRAALCSLALAAAAYQPASYNDAAARRAQLAAAFDIEITAAGDAGDDASYAALKTLRSTVIADLTARGANLPVVTTVTLPDNLPSLVVAYRLYGDASRADQITAETNVIHPAFLPTTIQVLAR